MGMKVKKISSALILMLCVTNASGDITTAVGNIQDISLLIDIGYYFHVEDQTPMILERVHNASDPFRTYEACRTTAITCNFNLTLTAQVRATSAAEGRWTAEYSPHRLSTGTTNVHICVRGENLMVERITGGKKVQVAELRIGVIPL